MALILDKDEIAEILTAYHRDVLGLKVSHVSVVVLETKHPRHKGFKYPLAEISMEGEDVEVKPT